MHEIGRRIRKCRKAKRISLERLAYILYPKWTTVDHSWLSKLERGEYRLTFDQFVLICWALGVDPGELAKGITPPE